MFSGKVNLRAGTNRIALLSVAVGLLVSFPFSCILLFDGKEKKINVIWKAG